MYCELDTSDTSLEPLNGLYSNSIHAALSVSDLAAVKISYWWHFIYKKMLTKVYKITKIISSLSLLIGFIAIPIGGIIWC